MALGCQIISVTDTEIGGGGGGSGLGAFVASFSLAKALGWVIIRRFTAEGREQSRCMDGGYFLKRRRDLMLL